MLRSSGGVPLWNVIYQFFVEYIFGGYWFGDYHSAFLGQSFSGGETLNTFNVYATTIHTTEGDFPLTLGNYLSLIATIISIVAIVLICCALIKKIYNMCAHIIG